METPGEYLKRERELRGASLKQMREATRVPLKYLEALEADNYDILPHPTFVKGYIKTCCKHLGLDDTDALLRFELYVRERAEKTGAVSREKTEPAKALFDTPSKKNAALAAAGIAAVLIIYFAYSIYPKKAAVKGQDPQAAAALEPQSAQPSAPEAAGKEGLKKQTEAQKAALQKKPAKEAPQPAVAQAAKPPISQISDDKLHTLTVRAKELVWIKIRMDDNEPFDVTLKQGEGITWRAKEVFSLIVGNAGGLEMFYDGDRIELGGKSGDVVSFKLPAEPPGTQPAPQQQ